MCNMQSEFHCCVVQIIDPFVEVEIIGLPIDCNKQQTRVVDDNGKYKSGLCKPNLAVLVFLKHCAKLKVVIFHVMSVLKQMTLKNHSCQKEPVGQKDTRVLNSNEMQSRDCIRN